MVMYGNGVMTGKRIIQMELQQTRRVRIPGNTVCCGAVVSTAMIRRLALPIGTSTRHPIGASSLGSVWRGPHNYCLANYLP